MPRNARSISRNDSREKLLQNHHHSGSSSGNMENSGSLSGNSSSGVVTVNVIQGGQVDDVNNNSLTLANGQTKHPANRDSRGSTQDILSSQLELSQNTRTKRSLYTLYLTSLMGAIGYSSCMTSAYPYLLSLNPNTTTALYGWVIAMYSIGQLIASPLLGYISQYFLYRPLFIFTIFLMVLGNVIYAYLSLFPEDLAGYMMLLARFILGFGAGNMTLIRTYASAVTSYEDRPVTMAWVTGTQALGFVIGPVIQTAFTPLDTGVTFDAIQLQISMYTMPAFLAALINAVNMVVFNVNFREIGRSQSQMNPEVATTTASSIIPSKNFISVVLCNVLWFTFLFDFSFFETIMTPLVQAEYAWSYSKTVFYNGILLFSNAVMSSLVYVSTRLLTKHFKERHLLAVSTLLLALSFVFLIPFSSEYPQLACPNNSTECGNSTSEYLNMTRWGSERYVSEPDTTILGLDLSFVGSSDENTYNSEIIGCNLDVYEWCAEQHKILFVQFVLCACTLSLTYPIGIVTTTSLFSQTIETSSKQGIYQGILTASGSLSRALGPVFVSNVFEKHGPAVVFPCITGMTFFIFCLVCIFNKRFGPAAIVT